MAVEVAYLFVPFEVAESRKSLVTKLTGIRCVLGDANSIAKVGQILTIRCFAGRGQRGER